MISAFGNLGLVLNQIYNNWRDSAISQGFETGTLRTQFFTPELDLDTLIVPVTVVGGIVTVISTFFAPATAVAGIATFINGLLTYAGLTQVEYVKVIHPE